MKALFLACLLVGGPLLSAPAALLRSPEVHHAVATDTLQNKEFYWDERTGFAVALTYSNADFMSRNNPPESQTLLFHFPGVRHVAGHGLFVVDEGGRAIPVARKAFLGSIRLAEGNHLLIHRRHDAVRVTLALGE